MKMLRREKRCEASSCANRNTPKQTERFCAKNVILIGFWTEIEMI